MVIEVTKECDVVRIGIDRYSLKTGINLRTIMDLSLRVMKEPRGFIRVIQCVMAIIAFSTTAGFSTECEFSIICADFPDKPHEVDYVLAYPFSHTEVLMPNCLNDELVNLRLPFNYSSASRFYVATGVLSFLYTLGILMVYICFHQTYANDTKVPVLDLVITVILAIFWMAGSSAWAQGVTDLKYYLHPDTVFNFWPECMKDKSVQECATVEDGSYGLLNASLVVGFGNFLLWAASLWFIYKETIFHTPEMPPESAQNQLPIGRSTDIRKV